VVFGCAVLFFARGKACTAEPAHWVSLVACCARAPALVHGRVCRYVLHIGAVESGTLKVGDTVRAEVDYERRTDIAPNHTMTHALNFALRRVLGHTLERPVEQKGSLVTPDKLRFDFSYGKGLTKDQLLEVDRIVTAIVTSALKVHNAVVPLAKARAIHSLCAVFGETYPDPVRVVSVGVPVEKLVEDPTNPEWSNFSVELCGGTHIEHSSAVCAMRLPAFPPPPHSHTPNHTHPHPHTHTRPLTFSPPALTLPTVPANCVAQHHLLCPTKVLNTAVFVGPRAVCGVVSRLARSPSWRRRPSPRAYAASLP
jgi:Ser-tRNA(Ala) deacylase AlaX